jgi:hypothetical protein
MPPNTQFYIIFLYLFVLVQVFVISPPDKLGS